MHIAKVMKRYTATFRTLGNPPDWKNIQRLLDSTSLNDRYLLVLNEIVQDGNSVLIELQSEAGKEKLATTLASLSSSLNMRFEGITWGWLASDSVLRDVRFENGEGSSVYPSSAPQLADTHIYPYGYGMTLVTVLWGIVFLMSVASFVAGILNSIHVMTLLRPDMTCVMTYWCPLWAFAFSYMLFYWVSSIKCDPNGIEVRYSLRPPERLRWRSILSLKIYRAMGERWCSVQGVSRAIRFPINDFYELHDRAMLIRTIIKHAALLYVEGALWENAIYRRSDAP